MGNKINERNKYCLAKNNQKIFSNHNEIIFLKKLKKFAISEYVSMFGHINCAIEK
jgi:hypothetical protein